MADPRHIVVGTAGHVDHGKTALVKALTGVDCDRLPEEKKRGITIELGFASWSIAPDLGASIIDVPGHERFVGTMVAGASGIDVVVLVVAADDGVMPQTKEHLAICELLGVRSGVIAITKCDLASDDLLELVEDDIRLATKGTFLEQAKIVRTSVNAGRGIEELTAAVREAASPKRARAGGNTSDAQRRPPAFLAIDRVFTRAGAGTIVTGTLVRGSLSAGTDVDVLPTESGAIATLRIRGMEAHGRACEEAHAPTRLALNLRGDGAEAVRRGSVVVTRGTASPTTALHVKLDLLEPLEAEREVQAHLGTSAVPAKVRLLEENVALLRSPKPFATYAGQRLVLRRSSKNGNVTIGGGVVVDPHPSRSRRRGMPFFFLAATPRDRIHALVAEARFIGLPPAEIERRALLEDEPKKQVKALLDARAIIEHGGRLYDASILEAAKASVEALVADLHRERPLVAGFASGELETRAPERHRPLIAHALDVLVAEKKLVRDDGGLLRAKGHRTEGERAQVLERVLACYRAAGLAPPMDDIAATQVDLPPAAFKDAAAELRRRGALRLIGGMNFDTEALAALRTKVARWFDANATLAPTQFKELAGELTRKHAIPLLEWLDQERVTIRKGDARIKGSALPA